MSGFLKTETQIKVTVKADAHTANEIAYFLQIILNHTSASELRLISEAVQRPMLKSMALGELKKRL